MARQRTLWIAAAVWDSLRILLVFILISVFQDLVLAIPNALFAALLGPALVFPATAMVLARREPPGSGLALIWLLSKVFSICSLLYLAVRFILAGFGGPVSEDQLVASQSQIVSFVVPLLLLVAVDASFGVYGLFRMRRDAAESPTTGGEA